MLEQLLHLQRCCFLFHFVEQRDETLYSYRPGFIMSNSSQEECFGFFSQCSYRGLVHWIKHGTWIYFSSLFLPALMTSWLYLINVKLHNNLKGSTFRSVFFLYFACKIKLRCCGASGPEVCCFQRRACRDIFLMLSCSVVLLLQVPSTNWWVLTLMGGERANRGERGKWER